MEWKLTGPIDESLERFKDYKDCAFIVLGDTNFFGNKKILKQRPDLKFYCVRGTYEKNPYTTPGLITRFDSNVKGLVYSDLKYPNVCYFVDGEIYTIADKKVLVIGGGNVDNEIVFIKRKNFSTEEISDKRKKEIESLIRNKKIDIVLTYSAPYSWGAINNELERWLDKIKNTFVWNEWYFAYPYKDGELSKNIKMVHNDIWNMGGL